MKLTPNKNTTLVLLLVVLFMSLFMLYSSYEPFTPIDSNTIKILNLVLYSSDNNRSYDKMKQITEKYYNKFPNVKTIYYRFSPEISQKYELRDNVLHIQGDESYTPGILQKTIDTFEYFRNELSEYQYIVRSNISTIIRFDLLSNDLEQNSVDYGCGLCFSDSAHTFSSGTSIILSPKMVINMIDNKSQFNYDIIDDVSIGQFIKQNMPETEMKSVLKSLTNNGFSFFPDFGADQDKIKEYINQNEIAFYRNRINDDRELDVKQMEVIISVLEQQSK